MTSRRGKAPKCIPIHFFYTLCLVQYTYGGRARVERAQKPCITATNFHRSDSQSPDACVPRARLPRRARVNFSDAQVRFWVLAYIAVAARTRLQPATQTPRGMHLADDMLPWRLHTLGVVLLCCMCSYAVLSNANWCCATDWRVRYPPLQSIVLASRRTTAFTAFRHELKALCGNLGLLCLAAVQLDARRRARAAVSKYSQSCALTREAPALCRNVFSFPGGKNRGARIVVCESRRPVRLARHSNPRRSDFRDCRGKRVPVLDRP